jgi:hypothetical protein
MDLASLVLGLALLLLVAFYVVRPLVEGRALRERQPGPADSLLAERERILTALRDLDFDYATGKLVDEDFVGPRAELLAHGAQVLRQLDALGVDAHADNGHADDADHEPAVSAVPAAGKPAPDDEIEQAVARRRRERANRQAPPVPGTDDEIEAAVAPRRAGRTAHEGGAALVCSECHTPAQPGDRFCARCGTGLPAKCGNCGRQASPGDVFGADCGQQLAPAAGDLRQAGAGG